MRHLYLPYTCASDAEQALMISAALTVEDFGQILFIPLGHDRLTHSRSADLSVVHASATASSVVNKSSQFQCCRQALVRHVSYCSDTTRSMHRGSN